MNMHTPTSPVLECPCLASVEQEGNLAWHWNLRIYKLNIFNGNLVAEYWDTVLVQYLYN